jgi:hypothetical protein
MEEYDRKKREEEANRALVTPIPPGGLVPMGSTDPTNFDLTSEDEALMAKMGLSLKPIADRDRNTKINPMSQPPGW